MELKINYRPIATLIPYAQNARTHSPAQVAELARLIAEFGFNNPIAIDAEGGVIAGHGRILAAESLGMKNVPTITLDLTERQKRAYILADNKIALKSGWDFDILAEEINALAELDEDLSFTGFDDEELNSLLKAENNFFPEEPQEMAPPKTPKIAKKKEASVVVHTCPHCGEKFSA